MKRTVLVVILLLVFFILTLSAALRTSGTCDEIAHHIPVGYVLLTKWDLKMDTSQPPLARYIIALPLRLFMKINMPDDKKEWRVDDRSRFGRDFFYKYNSDPKKMLLLCRIPVMIIGVLCGLLLLGWATSLYGERAGILSLFLYSLSPNIIAHAGLATTDMIATFFIFLSVYAFWLFLCEPSFRKTLFAGFCLGLAQLSKYNAALLYPVFLILILFELPVKSRSNIANLFSKFFIVIFISSIVVWSGYGFDFRPILKDTMRIEKKLEIVNNVTSKFIPNINSAKLEDILLHTPVPLGEHILGIMGVIRHTHEGHGTYFLGKWSGHGNLLYFLTAFLIKNPIPMLALFIIGIFLTFRNRIGKGEKVIFITIIVFFTISSFGNLQIGLRHILPLFPLCFIVAGRSEELLKKKGLNIVVAVLIVWHIASTLLTWPYYLSYFNEVIGGPKNGYKILRDSNLDWGQDLPALADYMKKNSIKEVVFEYFGQADPVDYGVHYRKFLPEELEKPGDNVYAISAQYLDNIRWTKDYKPKAMAGYSIFIYQEYKQ